MDRESVFLELDEDERRALRRDLCDQRLLRAERFHANGERLDPPPDPEDFYPVDEEEEP